MLESLDELDQRVLIVIAQLRFAADQRRAKIVTAIDDEIRTLVQFEKRPRHIGKDFEQLGVGRVLRHHEQVVLQPDQEADQLFYVNDPLKPEHFTKQIAFNVIPHCDIFMDDGSTKEEWKMAAETRKILDPDIAVTATCVRVPVFIGHGEAVNVEFERPLSEDQARAALRQAPGVTVVDHRADEGYVTPAEAAGEDAVYVSRIRRDPTVPYGLNLWVVADNLRKGAALNAVQIAEILVKQHLGGRRGIRSNVEPLRPH